MKTTKNQVVQMERGAGMKERPIIFSAPMIRAILREENPKTMTRRRVKPQPRHEYDYYQGGWECWTDGTCPLCGDGHGPIPCLYGQTGDRMWVRETWCPHNNADVPWIGYKADGDYRDLDLRWRPSIHMPRWASRITLEITDVRIERLQDINEEDAIAEGMQKNNLGTYWCGAPHKALGTPRQFNTAIEAFADIWDSINAKRPGCNWASNPFVWVISFKRVE